MCIQFFIQHLGLDILDTSGFVTWRCLPRWLHILGIFGYICKCANTSLEQEGYVFKILAVCVFVRAYWNCHVELIWNDDCMIRNGRCILQPLAIKARRSMFEIGLASSWMGLHLILLVWILLLQDPLRLTRRVSPRYTPGCNICRKKVKS